MRAERTNALTLHYHSTIGGCSSCAQLAHAAVSLPTPASLPPADVVDPSHVATPAVAGAGQKQSPNLSWRALLRQVMARHLIRDDNGCNILNSEIDEDEECDTESIDQGTGAPSLSSTGSSGSAGASMRPRRTFSEPQRCLVERGYRAAVREVLQRDHTAPSYEEVLSKLKM
jgi:hypothetical protein